MRLRRVAAPTAKPVSLADLKAHLRIDDSDSDAILGTMLDFAIGQVDGYDGIGFCCCLQTWRLHLDAFPRSIELPLGPVADDAAITIHYIATDGGEVTLDPARYRLSGGVIDPAFGEAFPATRCIRNAVTIDFPAGTDPADVPPAIKQAILEIAAERYLNRETSTVGEMSEATADSLEPYRSKWISA